MKIFGVQAQVGSCRQIKGWQAAVIAVAFFMPWQAEAQTWEKYPCEIDKKQAVCVKSGRFESVQVQRDNVNVNRVTGAHLESQRVAYEEQEKGWTPTLPTVGMCDVLGWVGLGAMPHVRTENLIGGRVGIIERRDWAYQTMEDYPNCTQPRLHSRSYVWSTHTFEPTCPDIYTWAYRGPADVRSGQGICYQVCSSPGTRWSTQANACKKVVDKYDNLPQACTSPRGGNPIYPLTGSKSQNQALLLPIGRDTVTLHYDTRGKVVVADDAGYPMSEPSPSFGELWLSSLHTRIVFQRGGKGVDLAAQVSRGSGVWLSFTLNASGQYLPEQASTSDRLIRWGPGWRYIDTVGQAIETYPDALAQGALGSRVYARGGSLTYTYSTTVTPEAPVSGLLRRVQDSFGRAIQFEYEQPAGVAAPRIRAVVDTGGQRIVAAYDAAGNLHQLTWADASARRFLYESPTFPWALTGIVDENNRRLSTYTYDTEGRATSTEQGGGVNRHSTSYTQGPRRMVAETYDSVNDVLLRHHTWLLPQDPVMTLPTGGGINYITTLVNGSPRVTSQSQPAGSGCAASTSQMSYDATGNLASRDDFNGGRTCYAHDPGRNLETTRVEGLSASAGTTACSSVIAAGSNLPSGVRKITTQWHPDWPMEIKRAEPGKVTTSIYNGQPDFTNGNAPASCAPSTALLTDNKPIAVLCKRIEQATTDANGSRPEGAGLPTEPQPLSNPQSLLLHMDGTAGARTFVDSGSYAHAPAAYGNAQHSRAQSRFGGSSGLFDGNGDYLLIPHHASLDLANGDFTVEMWVRLNATGGATIVLNKASGSNRFPYQVYYTGSKFAARGFNGSASLAFDFSGVTVAAVNTWYHLALTRSGSNFRLFVNGNVEASGVYAGSLLTTSDPLSIGAYSSGTYSFNGYLDEVRITKGEARYSTSFTVPTTAFPGGVPSVIDTNALARTWAYTYNALGQMLTEDGPRTDAVDVTTYTYYSDTTADHTTGDLAFVTDATGSVTQYTHYNKYGQVLTSINPNGVVSQNTYDLRQRLLTTTVDAQTTSYTYDPAGQLKRLTLPDLSYVGYDYDDAHRLVAVYDHKGNRTDYALDNAGNRIKEETKDISGALKRQLDRSIDALGRVQQSMGRE